MTNRSKTVRSMLGIVVSTLLLLQLNTALADIDESDIEALIGADWYGLYLNGQKAGYAHMDFGKAEFRGEQVYRTSVEVFIKVAMLGTTQEITTVEKRAFALDGSLLSLSNEMDTAGQHTVVLGEVQNDVLFLSTNIGGQHTTNVLPAPPDNLTDALEEALFISPATQVGDTHEFSVFEPLLQQSLTAVCEVKSVSTRTLEGVPTSVFEVETKLDALGVTTTALVTEDGQVLEDSIGGMFTMRLEDETTAKDLDFVNDVVVANAIRVEKEIEQPDDVVSLRAELSNLSDNLVLEDARQRFTALGDDSYMLEVRKETQEGAGVPVGEVDAGEFRDLLMPSLFIQSTDPAIKTLAGEIVGEETRSFRIVEKLGRWVYANLEKEFTASLTNALDTLAARAGDCTEHSVLFVALARAAGVPARPVAGVVYSNDAGGAFYFHQWAEVFVGGWVATDPTFDQPVADATHIKLVQGDLFEQTKIISAIQKLGIEILEYSAGG